MCGEQSLQCLNKYMHADNPTHMCTHTHKLSAHALVSGILTGLPSGPL